MSSTTILNIPTVQTTLDVTSQLYAVTGAGVFTDTRLSTSVLLNNTTLTGAPVVPYTIPGGVSRTMLAKFQDTISVKEYGAIGNGTTDDTTAIQNAINAVMAVNGALYFPAGTYLVSGTLSAVNASKFITLFGAGMFATTIVTNNATADILHFALAGYELSDMQLSANV